MSWGGQVSAERDANGIVVFGGTDAFAEGYRHCCSNSGTRHGTLVRGIPYIILLLGRVDLIFILLTRKATR